MSYSASQAFDVRLEAYCAGQWLSLRNLMTYYRTMSNYNISYATGLRSAWDETAKLAWDAPVARDRRFPAGQAYVCLLAGDWSNKFTTLRASMMSIARILNVELGRNDSGGSSSSNQPHQQQQQQANLDATARANLANAALSYSQTLKSMADQAFRQEGVFTRAVFEGEMNLVWTATVAYPNGVTWEDVASYIGLTSDQLWVGTSAGHASAAAWPGAANTTTLEAATLPVPNGTFRVWSSRATAGRACIQISQLNGFVETVSISAQPAND